MFMVSISYVDTIKGGYVNAPLYLRSSIRDQAQHHCQQVQEDLQIGSKPPGIVSDQPLPTSALMVQSHDFSRPGL
jgi:archaellum component FlaG (FlaF/FlaG flagellin family)